MNLPIAPASLDEIDATLAALAQDTGFSQAGIAPIPPAAETGNYAELDYFATWIERGYAGEMEYLKRRDSENRLLRSSLRIPFPWARSVIVCAANYHAHEVKSIDPAAPERGWIARYAWTGYRTSTPDLEKPAIAADAARARETPTPKAQTLAPSDYHKVLLRRLEKLEGKLQQTFGPFESRCYVDTGPVVERVYAKYAGLGWTGKNTCMINQQMGSWFFLGVMLTGLELPSSRPLKLAQDRCGSCTRCIDACPTGALAPYQMDASLCIAYLTIEKRGSIPEQLRSQMGRQVFGCDICQDVCPWNRRAPLSRDAELAVRTELVNPALEWLAELDANNFHSLFSGSPIARAKLPGLLRNVAIAMGNSGLPRYLPKLREWARSADPVLAEAAQWAIHRLVASKTVS
jgi:epoxyqueuosine reductase